MRLQLCIFIRDHNIVWKRSMPDGPKKRTLPRSERITIRKAEYGCPGMRLLGFSVNKAKWYRGKGAAASTTLPAIEGYRSKEK